MDILKILTYFVALISNFCFLNTMSSATKGVRVETFEADVNPKDRIRVTDIQNTR